MDKPQFILDFTKQNQGNDFTKNAYATFCINFVNTIKKQLNYKEISIKRNNVDYLRIMIDYPHIFTRKNAHKNYKNTNKIKKEINGVIEIV